MYIRYEPLVVAKAGLEATLMHAGRSSQDIHATFQRAILRDETLKLLKAQAAAVTGLLKLAHENEDTLIPCYTNGVAAQPSNILNFPKNLHSNTGTGDYFPKKVISS